MSASRPSATAFGDLCLDRLLAERNLRYQDDIADARDAGANGDPTEVSVREPGAVLTAPVLASRPADGRIPKGPSKPSCPRTRAD